MNSNFDPELDPHRIRRALSAVGELLEADGEPVAIVVTGGATLNLLGILERTTTDVDVIARADRDDEGSFRLREAEPFPPALSRAIRTVARDLGLDEEWMNAAVGEQWSLGFPPWMDAEIRWTRYGGLDVGLVGRRTLVALKLFAAVDQGRESVHFQDLLLLEPTDEELAESRDWVVTRAPNPIWPELVDTVVERVRDDD